MPRNGLGNHDDSRDSGIDWTRLPVVVPISDDVIDGGTSGDTPEFGDVIDGGLS